MQQTHATGIVQGAIDHNRGLLLWSLIGLYFIMLVIHANYHAMFTFSDAFGHWVIGIVVALVLATAVQVVRFVLVITGTKEISRGGLVGWVGMAFSLGITGYLAYELPHIAEWWSKGDPAKLTAILIVTQMLNWFGFVLEILLVASVSRDLREDRAAEARRIEAKAKKHQDNRSNGQGQGNGHGRGAKPGQELEPMDLGEFKTNLNGAIR